jgi:uncharacterized protein DUF3631
VVVSITEAVMFRKIEKVAPTLLLDEIDAVFTAKKGDDGKEAIRALLNAGFERRAIVPRCVGPNHALKEFRVFCPKALAGIGKLPDTIADRSIPIIMARRKRGQNVEKFRARDAEVIAKPVAVALEAWASRPQTLEILRAARPTMPNALSDRATDICEPLLAIADMAGGDWPSKARDALVELCAAGDVAEDCIGIKLLAAIREIFEVGKVDRISTKDLLAALIERDCDEPWADWWEADIAKGNTRGPAAKLARLFEAIWSRRGDDSRGAWQHRERLQARIIRGRLLSLPLPLSVSRKSPKSRHNVTTRMNTTLRAIRETSHRESVTFSKMAGKPHQ